MRPCYAPVHGEVRRKLTESATDVALSCEAGSAIVCYGRGNISAKGFRHGKLVEDIGAVLAVVAAGLRGNP